MTKRTIKADDKGLDNGCKVCGCTIHAGHHIDGMPWTEDSDNDWRAVHTNCDNPTESDSCSIEVTPIEEKASAQRYASSGTDSISWREKAAILRDFGIDVDGDR